MSAVRWAWNRAPRPAQNWFLTALVLAVALGVLCLLSPLWAHH